jgi:hypothetical protein
MLPSGSNRNKPTTNHTVRKLLKITMNTSWGIKSILLWLRIQELIAFCYCKIFWFNVLQNSHLLYKSYQLVRQLCLWLPLSDAYLLLKLKIVKQFNSRNESDVWFPCFSISRFQSTFPLVPSDTSPLYMSCICTQDWRLKNQCRLQSVCLTTAQQHLTCALFNK